MTKDSGPEGAAVCVISTTQTFNIISCFMVLAILMHNKSVLNKPIVITISIFFLVLNYIRYIYKDNKNYAVLKEKWTKEINVFQKGIWVLTYVLFSTILFFGLAIYLGSKKSW